MDTLDSTQQDALARVIVEQYGDSVLRADKYLFDQMTRLSPGTTACCIKASEFASTIKEDEIIILLDPHPSNRPYAQEVAKHCGQPDALAFRARKKEIVEVLRFSDCDVYLLSRTGSLLAAATHEDSEENGERLIWIPMANTSNT